MGKGKEYREQRRLHLEVVYLLSLHGGHGIIPLAVYQLFTFGISLLFSPFLLYLSYGRLNILIKALLDSQWKGLRIRV